MKLDDLPEKYRRQAEAQLRSARPHANMERRDALTLDKVEADKRFDSPVRVHFHHIRKRLADLDNLCGKAVLDGLIACGILEDDRQAFVKEIKHTQEIGKEERTIVTVEEI